MISVLLARAWMWILVLSVSVVNAINVNVSIRTADVDADNGDGDSLRGLTPEPLFAVHETVGKECANAYGMLGVCKLPWDCKIMKSLLRKRIYPNICGYEPVTNIPVICCAYPRPSQLTTSEKPLSKSQKDKGKKQGINRRKQEESNAFNEDSLKEVTYWPKIPQKLVSTDEKSLDDREDPVQISRYRIKRSPDTRIKTLAELDVDADVGPSKLLEELSEPLEKVQRQKRVQQETEESILRLEDVTLEDFFNEQTEPTETDNSVPIRNVEPQSIFKASGETPAYDGNYQALRERELRRRPNFALCLNHLRQEYLQRLQNDALPYVSKKGSGNYLPVENLEDVWRVQDAERKAGHSPIQRYDETLCPQYNEKIAEELEFELTRRLIELYRRQPEEEDTKPLISQLPPHPDDDIILDEEEGSKQVKSELKKSRHEPAKTYGAFNMQTFRTARRRRWSDKEYAEPKIWEARESGRRTDEEGYGGDGQRRGYQKVRNDSKDKTSREEVSDLSDDEVTESASGRRRNQNDDTPKQTPDEEPSQHQNKRPTPNDEEENVRHGDSVVSYVDESEENESRGKPSDLESRHLWGNHRTTLQPTWTTRSSIFNSNSDQSQRFFGFGSVLNEAENYLIHRPNHKTTHRPDDYGFFSGSNGSGNRPNPYDSEPENRPTSTRVTTRHPQHDSGSESYHISTGNRPSQYDSDPINHYIPAENAGSRPNGYDSGSDTSYSGSTGNRPNSYDSEFGSNQVPLRTTTHRPQRVDLESNSYNPSGDRYDSDSKRTTTRRPDPDSLFNSYENRPNRYDSRKTTTRRPDQYDSESDAYRPSRTTTRRPDRYDSDSNGYQPSRTTSRRPDSYDSDSNNYHPSRTTTRRPDRYDSDSDSNDYRPSRTTTRRPDRYDSDSNDYRPSRTTTRRPDRYDSDSNDHHPSRTTTRRPDSYDSDSNDYHPSRTTTRRPDSYDSDSNNYQPSRTTTRRTDYESNIYHVPKPTTRRPDRYDSEDRPNHKPKTSPKPYGGVMFPTMNSGSWENENRATTRRNSVDGSIVYPGPASTTTNPPRYKPKSTKAPLRAPRISEIKCAEYKKLTKSSVSALPLSIDSLPSSVQLENCPQNGVSLIVGGKEAVLNEFPHMVALGYKSRGRVTYSCGGTLISENFVLTAAHCIETSLGKPVSALLGELTLNDNDDGAHPIDIKIDRTWVHPDYKTEQKYYDIALVRLDREVSFNDGIRPACLQQEKEFGRSDIAVATGWGTTDYGGKRSDILLKVGLNIINNTMCNQLYDKERKHSSSLDRGIVDAMLCAGKLEGGKDTCLGDSGGPLVIPHRDSKCHHYVVGVTSFGRICGQESSPGVYTRVSAYLPWIENIVWNGQQ